MKKEVMSFAVVVKGGIVQQIGKGVVSRPETCFSFLMVHQLCKAFKVSRNLRPSQSLLILVQYYVSVSDTLAPLRFHSSLCCRCFVYGYTIHLFSCIVY